MREIRSSGSVEGVVRNHDPYSDSQAKARRVSVGLRVLAEIFEAAITIASTACRFRVNFVQEIQNCAD